MKTFGFCSTFLLLVLFTCYDEIHSLDSPCGSWVPFKDEKCFGILDDTLRTFSDAEMECAKLENSPTLAVIHSEEEQEFLSNFLFKTSKKVENFWLGAKFVNSNVAWIDNSELSYTNWDSRNYAPRNKPNYCVQMKYDETVVGKWIDEPCETKNLVVCQRMQTWRMPKLQKIVLDLKEALDGANMQISNLKHMLESEKVSSSDIIADLKKMLEEDSHKNISDSKQNLIPIGFIYSQLPNEKSPSEIWPSMSWTDVSATYAGVFFRVNGAGSESFGKIQEENDRTLVRLESSMDRGSSVYQTSTVNTTNQSTNTSDWLFTGIDHFPFNHLMHMRIVAQTGEVRPRNMAMRVWKRTG